MTHHNDHPSVPNKDGTPHPPPLHGLQVTDDLMATIPAVHPTVNVGKDVIQEDIEAPLTALDSLTSPTGSQPPALPAPPPSPQVNPKEPTDTSPLTPRTELDIHLRIPIPRLHIFAASNTPTLLLILGALLILLSVGLFLYQYMNTPAPTVQRPIVLPPTTAVQSPTQLELYRADHTRIIKTLHTISGTVPAQSSLPATSQNLWSLYNALQMDRSQLAATLQEKGLSRAYFSSTYDEIPPSYEVLWQLGSAVRKQITAEIETLEAKYNANEINALNDDIATLRGWLYQWQLGDRGLYCQLRQRYWQQKSEGTPKLKRAQQNAIKNIRKERREVLLAAGQKNVPLYELCATNIF